MRAQARRVSHEEEEESVFVSMTDMTVGFLFIIMILLVFFASQVRTKDVVPRSTYDFVVEERDKWQVLAEDRAAEVVRLQAELDAARRENEKLQTKNSELLALILELRQRITELENEIKRLQAVDPLETYLARVAATRRDILIRLRDAILVDFPGLQVELSEESDALRFQGEGLFVSGRSTLSFDKQTIVSRLAQRLDEVLPCFTTGERSRFEELCNPHYVMIEAVQIEGHTDDVGSDFTNRNLSTARANTTFFTMTEAASEIMGHRNLKEQPVLSVAAYGPDRPIADNKTSEGRATNRRIDLRFIMVRPQDEKGIETIRIALRDLAKVEP